ncbi:MAG: hypothetical protein GY946_26870 [bacterium]|nr:hypothetical protein [bacterium]
MVVRVALICVLITVLGAAKPEAPNLGKGQPLPEVKAPKPSTQKRSKDNERRPKTQSRSGNPQKRVRKPHIEQIVPFSSCSPGGPGSGLIAPEFGRFAIPLHGRTEENPS